MIAPRPASRRAVADRHASRLRAVGAGSAMACFMALGAASAVAAGAFPVKPVRFIVPFAAGGAADVMARTIGSQFSQAWGQTMIVDNRTGAGGLIAAELTARAGGDGYTLMLAEPALASLPSLYSKLPIDVMRDFTPLGGIATAPQVMTVAGSVTARGAQELIAYARANPGKVNFGSPGRGTTGDLSGELFRMMGKFEFTVVPYKGAVPALAALAGGEVTLTATSMLAAMPLVKAGKIRAVGTTGPRRHGLTPELPTMAEQGLPGYQIMQWWGLVAPRGTPRPVVSTINAAIGQSLNTPEMKDRLAALYAEPWPSSPEAFGAFIRSEIDALGKIIRAAGIKAE
jgi:tripartite-type tricarboxylate transporter receptor subunit TctC